MAWLFEEWIDGIGWYRPRPDTTYSNQEVVADIGRRKRQTLSAGQPWYVFESETPQEIVFRVAPIMVDGIDRGPATRLRYRKA